eukprot:COSAG02_NODE_43258_length_376_cov_1.144404_2_plen_26_part_01
MRWVIVVALGKAGNLWGAHSGEAQRG